MSYLAFAKLVLGVSSDEFWKLTPAQFFAMADIHGEREKKEDARFGILTMVMRRIMGDKRAGVFDLFPEHKQEVDEKIRVKKAKEGFRALMEQQKKKKVRHG